VTRERSGSEPDMVIDWQRVAIFGAGTLLGVTLGAGAALLFAPKSGRATRRDLARSGRRWRSRTTDAWDDLRDDLHFAARRGRRKLERAIRDRWQRRGQEPEQPTLID
jgi:gas vesicle protein